MLRYSLLRLLIFFGVLAALWLLGLRDPEEQIWLLLLAAVISMTVSWFVLRPFREEYSRQIAERIERRATAKRQARMSSDEQAEDAEDSRDPAARPGSDPDEPAEYR